MNGIEHYDWIEIYESNATRERWAEGLYQHKSNDAKAAYKSASPEPEYIKPKLTINEMLALDLVLASIKPVKVGNTYSSRETLLGIKDPQMQALIKCCGTISRSNLMSSSGTGDTRHCSLVPLFLAAQKEYNGIAYEMWDKTDPTLRILVGRKLYDDITEWGKKNLSEELRVIARRNALKTGTGKQLKPTDWPRHTIKLSSTEKLGALNFFRHIWLQTWVANVEYRNEYMILDVNNWDLVPPALDAVFDPKEDLKKEVRMEIAEDLPW